jgi:SAM-dependent methyltransferase
VKQRLLLAGVICGIAAFVAWRVTRWIRAARRQELPAMRGGGGLLGANRAFYDELWSGARLVDPHRFNTWPLVCELVGDRGGARLEVGPGLRPRLPISGTHFVDVSEAAAGKLRERGGRARVGSAAELPYADGEFDLVCAMDIVEHAEDDEPVLTELARVTRPGGAFLLAVPLHAGRWTPFDDFVGHRERYEPQALTQKLERHGFVIERSAAYGMQPKAEWLSEFGLRCLLQRRERAMWYYTHLFMPLGLWMQPRLQFAKGWIPLEGVDEVLLVCRKES